MALTISQVNQGFLALFGRPATGVEAAKFANVTDLAALTNAIAADKALSAEIVTPFPVLSQPDLNAATNELFVESLYSSLIGRASDAEGSAFWLGELAAGVSRADILARFTASLEAQALEGTADGQAFLNAQAENEAAIHTWLEELYSNTLGRPADQEGLDYWTSTVLAGNTPAQVAAAFAATLAAQGDTTTDGQIFANKVGAADAFTKDFNDFNSFVSAAEKQALYNELRDMIKEIDQNTKPEDYADSIATKVNTYEKAKLANINYTSSDEDVLGVDADGNINTTSAVHFKGTYDLSDETKGTIQSTDQITGNDLFQNNILEVGVKGITTEAKNLDLDTVTGTIQNDSIQKLVVNNDKATVSGTIDGEQWKTVEILGGGGSTADDTTNLTIGSNTKLSLLKVASKANTAAQNAATGFAKNAVTIDGTVASVEAGAGSDSLTVAGTVGNVDLGAGADTFVANGQIIKGSTIKAGAGDDKVTLNLTAIDDNVNRSNITVDLGAGDDTLTIAADLEKATDLKNGGIQNNITLDGGTGSKDTLVLAVSGSDSSDAAKYTAVSEISGFEITKLNGTTANTSGAVIAADAADGLKTKLDGQGTLHIDAAKYSGNINLSGITKVDEFVDVVLGDIINASNVNVTLGSMALGDGTTTGIVGTDYNAVAKTTGNDTIKVSGQLKDDLFIDAKSTNGSVITDNINLTGLKVDKDAANQPVAHNITITNVGAKNSVIELSKKGVATEKITIVNDDDANTTTTATIKNYDFDSTRAVTRNDGDIVYSGGTDVAAMTTTTAKSTDGATATTGYTLKVDNGVLTTYKGNDATNAANKVTLKVDDIRAIIADANNTAIQGAFTTKNMVAYQVGSDTYLIGVGAATADVNDDIVIKLTGVKGVASLTGDQAGLILA